ncbi:MAG: hypothetical protein ACXVFN_12360 [Solirubrobacteraceae bacterium]
MSSTNPETGASTGNGATRAPLAPVAHFTTAERTATGTAARAEVPRKSHAGWGPPAVRFGPVELLEEQAKTRVDELVPIRYGRMLAAFAETYADQNERDYAALKAAATSGRIEAQTGL